MLDGRVDAWVLIATLALATASGLLFGTLPALRASNLSPAEVLKEEANRSSGGPHRGRLSGALVVAQLALSVVLLVAGGLFIRSVQKAHGVHPGFDADGVLLASFEASPATGYTADTALALQRAVLDRVEALPGVESATIADWVPLTLSAPTSEVEADGYVPREHESRDVRRAYVGPGYARTMRIRLAAGRDFTKKDGAAQEPVAIVNRAFADRYWPGLDPLGRRLRADGRWHSVVGVTENTAYIKVGETPRPLLYLPALSRWRFGTTLHVRVAGDPGAAAPLVVDAVHALNPELPVFNVTTLRASVAFSTIFERLAATFVGAFGAARPGPREPRHLRRHRLLDAPAHAGDRDPNGHGRVGLRRGAPRDEPGSALDAPGPRPRPRRLRRGGAPPAIAPLRRDPARPGHLRRRGPAADRRGPRRLVRAGSSRDPRGAERGPPPELRTVAHSYRSAVMGSTRAARRAGIRPATKAVATRARVATANVSGSRAFRP